MPLIVSEKKSTVVHYIHIPKTAGTSVKSFFEQRGYKYLLCTKGAMYNFPCTPQHFHEDINKYLGLDKLNHRFAFIRHPERRLLSEYYYRGVGDAGVTFDEFCVFTIFVTKFFPSFFDNHLRPQSEFISPDVRVFKLEEGLEQLSQYLEEVGCDSPEPDDKCNMPFVNKSNSSSGSLDLSLDRSTYRMVREKYSEDYIRYDNASDLFNEEDFSVAKKIKKVRGFVVLVFISFKEFLYKKRRSD